MRIFLSYRRSDSGPYAGRLRDALADRFGDDAVFQDVVSIHPGEDFVVAVDRALDQSGAVLVVIGPSWSEAIDGGSSARLDGAEDYVRYEVARALQRNLRVIPVLVDGASVPAASDLPADLRPLAHRQAVILDASTWHRDVATLIDSLAGAPQRNPRPRRWTWMAAGSFAVIAAVAVAAALSSSGDGGEETGAAPSDTTEMLECPPTTGEEWVALDLPPSPPAVGIVDEGMELSFDVRDGAYRSAGDGSWQVVLTVAMSVLTPSTSGEEAAYHGDWHYGALAVDGVDFAVSCFGSVDDELVLLERSGRARVGFTVDIDPSGWLALSIDGASVDVTSG